MTVYLLEARINEKNIQKYSNLFYVYLQRIEIRLKY